MSKDRRAPEWAMAAFKLLGLRTTQSCPLPDGGYCCFAEKPRLALFITHVKLWLKVLEKSWSYKIHKQADPSPQISLISVLFHRIATTHIHSNYGRGLNKPLWFHGIKSNWLPDCNSSSLIKRLRAEGSDLSSGPIVYNINKMWCCRLMSC